MKFLIILSSFMLIGQTGWSLNTNDGVNPDSLFAQHVRSADHAFVNGKFSLAIDLYKNALDIKPDSDYPKNQIALAEIELTYQKVIEEADFEFRAGNFQSAIEKYKNAIAIKPVEAYPKERIEEAERLKQERDQELNKNYQMILDKADHYFEEENYEEAHRLYTRAEKLKPGNKDVQKKIKKCDQYLKKKK